MGRRPYRRLHCLVRPGETQCNARDNEYKPLVPDEDIQTENMWLGSAINKVSKMLEAQAFVLCLDRDDSTMAPKTDILFYELPVTANT